jgi:hypothetical protein
VSRRRPFSISPSEILTTLICAAFVVAAFFLRSLPFVYFVVALVVAGVLRSLVTAPIRAFARLMVILVFVALGFLALSAYTREGAVRVSSRARADSARAYEDSLTRWQLTTIIWNQANTKSVGEAGARVKNIAEDAEGGSLRRRVLLLASDLYGFLKVRQENEPQAKADPDRAVAHAHDQIAYMDSTVSIYHRKYADRVHRAIRELNEAGQDDPALKRVAERPRNPAAVKEIADRLTALGLKARNK